MRVVVVGVGCIGSVVAAHFARAQHQVTLVARGERRSALLRDGLRVHIDDTRGAAWRNRIALRDFVRLPVFRPVRHASSIPGPIMIIAAERDDLTPLAPVLRAAELAGERAELHRYPVTHFEVYTGKLFQELVAKEIVFLERALRSSEEAGSYRGAAL